MYLALNDLASLFKERRGAEENHKVYTITDHSNCQQPKGVFIYMNEESGQLQEAIANGAIAAIWHRDKEIPRYTPNQFPLFLTEDPVQAVINLLEFYLEKLNGEAETEMDLTKFNLLNKKLLNISEQSNDLTEMLKIILEKNNQERSKGRG